MKRWLPKIGGGGGGGGWGSRSPGGWEGGGSRSSRGLGGGGGPFLQPLPSKVATSYPHLSVPAV